MRVRTEFTYDKYKDETTIFIWKQMRILDKRTMPGQLSSYLKKKIRESIQKEYNDK